MREGEEMKREKLYIEKVYSITRERPVSFEIKCGKGSGPCCAVISQQEVVLTAYITGRLREMKMLSHSVDMVQYQISAVL